jgi:large subunit ribosomal protein L22
VKIEAKLKYAKISAKKLRDVARVLPGKSATEAVSLMGYVRRKSARLLGTLLKSAMANAENNNNLPADRLIVDRVMVEEGPALKRFIPASRGSAHPIRKRMAHVNILLREGGEGGRK